MKYNFEQLVQVKDIKLSESERGHIRAHLAHIMQQESVYRHSLLQRGIYHGLRIALSSFLFFIFIGGTISAVADNALPGDPLYAFKLNVNEEVKGFFQNTPQEKVAYGAKRVENRVNEIKTLAESKTLTKAKQATVQKALDTHIKNLSVDLNTLSAVAPNAALSATTSLEETLKANKLVIENTENSDGSNNDAALIAVDATIQKVSDQEVIIISKEVDAITTEVEATSIPDSITPIVSPETKTTTATPVEP